jgi:hypothetical protein
MLTRLPAVKWYDQSPCFALAGVILKSVLARSDDRAHRCVGLSTQRISADLKYVLQQPIVDTVRRNRAGSGGGNCARKPVSSAFLMPVVPFSRPDSGKTAIRDRYRGSWTVVGVSPDGSNPATSESRPLNQGRGARPEPKRDELRTSSESPRYGQFFSDEACADPGCQAAGAGTNEPAVARVRQNRRRDIMGAPN